MNDLSSLIYTTCANTQFIIFCVAIAIAMDNLALLFGDIRLNLVWGPLSSTERTDTTLMIVADALWTRVKELQL